jgi:hypothetical protein
MKAGKLFARCAEFEGISPVKYLPPIIDFIFQRLDKPFALLVAFANIVHRRFLQVQQRVKQGIEPCNSERVK